MMCFPSPVDVFGIPKTIFGEDLEPQNTWWEWITRPRHQALTYRFSDNCKAGFTVALVNVPLSIALAIASGASPSQGVISCVWAGIISAIFSSSHFNVVGPTGALSGLLMSMVNSYTVDILPVLAFQAGLWLILFSILRLDKAMGYVSTGVAHGFSIGVAIVIATSQIPSAFGLKGVQPKENVPAKWAEDLRCAGSATFNDTFLFFATIVPLFMLAKRYRTVPWQIIFALIGIAFGKLLPEGSLVLLRTKYPNMELNFFQVTDLSNLVDPKWYSPSILIYSNGIAIVALLETLISSTIANNNVEDRHFLNFSSLRDSLGLGFSNIVTAVVGGIPSTAALARTSLMINCGAFSRVSGIISCISVWLLCSILLPWFAYIPMATVAAILMLVAYKLVDFHDLYILREVDTANLYSVIVTASACIMTDTFIGLVIGTVISVLLNLKGVKNTMVLFMEDGETFSSPTMPQPMDYRILFCQPQESILFVNCEKMKERVFKRSVQFRYSLPDEMNRKLVLDLALCTTVDFDGTRVLGEIISAHRSKGWRVDVVNAAHLRQCLALCDPLNELRKLEYQEL